MSWGDEALALFESHAINPNVAEAAGVAEENGSLVYPTGKRRSLNGKGHLNPTGQRVRAWWVHRGAGESSVLLTEGETDGLAAHSALSKDGNPFAGLPILAVPGCQYPPDTLAHGLLGYGIKTAYVCFDADAPGNEARDRAVRVLRDRGLRAIPVPLPRDEDLASWLAAGGDLANLIADSEASYEVTRKGFSFADVQITPVEWLWPRRIPIASLTVIAGDPEQGKSLFTCGLAAEVSQKGDTVLMANAEDSSQRVAERLKASGAVLGNIYPVEFLSLPGGCDRLREQVATTEAKLVTIDPYNAFLEDHVSAVKDQQIRGALAPLLAIARDYDCAVVVVCHLNREGDGSAIYRIPVGLRGSARSILSLVRGDEHTRLVHTKSSYDEKQPDLAYAFEQNRLVPLGNARLSDLPEGMKEERDGSDLIWSWDDEEA